MTLTNEFIREVLFNDGEGLDYADLNKLQGASRFQLWDAHTGLMGRTSENGTSGSGWTSVIRAWCNGGAPIPTAADRTIKLAAGVILMGVTGSYDPGLAPYWLAYYLTDGEVTLQAAANSSGQDRWDIVQVKLESIATDTDDQESRDFKDAATDAVTSQMLVKARKVQITASLKQGTPGTPPVEPTADSGYIKLAAIYVSNGLSGPLDATLVRDYRMPLGLRVIDVPGYLADLTDAAPFALAVNGSGSVVSGGNSKVARFVPLGAGAWYSGRVIAVGLHGMTTGTDPKIELVRREFSSGSPGAYSETVVADLTATLSGGTTLYREAALVSTPLWLDGYQAGGAQQHHTGGDAPPTANLPQLGLRLTSATASGVGMSVWYVRFKVACSP